MICAANQYGLHGSSWQESTCKNVFLMGAGGGAAAYLAYGGGIDFYHLQVTGSQGHGLYIYAANDLDFYGSDIYQNSFAGVYIYYTAKRIRFHGGQSHQNTEEALIIQDSCSGCIIEGMAFNANSQDGLNRPALRLIGDTTQPCIDNIIANCRMLDTQGTPTQGYGISEESGCDYNLIIGNNFRGNKLGAVSGLVGLHTKAVHNIGYNPVGLLTPPALSTSAIANGFSVPVDLYVTVGSTATTISKNGTSLGSFTSTVVAVHLEPAETITLSQTTGVSWTWFGE
jgi:hypothetical protein